MMIYLYVGKNICFFNFKALAILFKKCFENEYFSKQWKKVKVVPVHKRNDKESIKNYRPVSLLTICAKYF